ncbi:MAG: 4a-hydroxytetrahydrobiopterin dehydratase [Acidiferrobacterales bacterium]
MHRLSELECEACSIDAHRLSRTEITSLLPDIEGWELLVEKNVQKLQRIFVTNDYTKSMAFTNAVASRAESANHHPQILVEYGSVTVTWWTHKINGLHKNDFIMAAKTSGLF